MSQSHRSIKCVKLIMGVPGCTTGYITPLNNAFSGLKQYTLTHLKMFSLAQTDNF